MSSDGRGSATLFPVAVLALVSGVFYAVPRTAVLGAILITGFVDGALAAHLRVTQAVILPEIINVALGVGAWGGLCLRDPPRRESLKPNFCQSSVGIPTLLCSSRRQMLPVRSITRARATPSGTARWASPCSAWKIDPTVIR